MSNEQILELAVAAAAGAAAGTVYFLNLWTAVERLHSADNPVGVFIRHLIFRIAVVLIVFAVIAQHGMYAVLAAAAAFIAARTLIIKMKNNQPEAQVSE